MKFLAFPCRSYLLFVFFQMFTALMLQRISMTRILTFDTINQKTQNKTF